MSKQQSNEHDETAGLLPIRVLANLTGVNIGTLRAWERRYGLLTPHRTASGHRLYSQDDVNLINEVVGILDQGVPISRAEAVLQQRHAQQDSETEQAQDIWRRYRQSTITAIIRFDEVAIDNIYNEALSLYAVDVVMQRLVVPTLQELGRRWEEGEGSIAEEHYFTGYVRNRLAARLHHGLKSIQGKQLVIACIPGEYHELGIMMFALSAQAQGFRTLLLGPNLPLDELVAVVERSNSEAVILSGSFSDNYNKCRDEFTKLTNKLNVPVFVGGHISIIHNDAITKAGAIAIGEDVPRALRLIQETL